MQALSAFEKLPVELHILLYQTLTTSSTPNPSIPPLLLLNKRLYNLYASLHRPLSLIALQLILTHLVQSETGEEAQVHDGPAVQLRYRILRHIGVERFGELLGEVERFAGGEVWGEMLAAWVFTLVVVERSDKLPLAEVLCRFCVDVNTSLPETYFPKRTPLFQTWRGMTPLHFACFRLDVEMVGWLLGHGADANAQCTVLFRRACWSYDSWRPVNAVLEGFCHFSRVSPFQPDGGEAAGKAARILRMLGEAGADFAGRGELAPVGHVWSVFEKWLQQPRLQLQERVDMSGFLREVLPVLVEGGADVNVLGWWGRREFGGGGGVLHFLCADLGWVEEKMVALEVLERYGVELDRRNFEWAGVSALEVLICAYDGREKREEWRRMVEWFLRRGCELSEKLPERVSLEMRERYETNLPMVVEILRGIMEEAVINIVEEMEAWGGCESEGEEGSCGEWSGSECGSEDGGDMETFEATEMVTEIDGGECRKWSDSGCDAGGERSDGEDDGTMKASDLVVCGGEEALVLLYGEEWSTDTETGTECSEEEGLFSDVESAGSVSEYDEEVDEMVVDGEEAKADTAVLEGAVEFEVGDVEMMEVDTCQSPSDHLEQGSIGASESGTARQGRKPSKPRQRVASFITIGGRRHFRRRRARRF